MFHESYDGTPEIPHERRWRLFVSNKSLGPLLGCLRPGENGCGFLTDLFNQFGMVKSLHRILFLGGFRWLVHDWISKTSIKAISRPFSHDPFGCRNHHRPKNEVNSREPPGTPKPTIGCFNQFHDEPNLYIGNVWNAPNFHLSIGKTGWISGAPGDHLRQVTKPDVMVGPRRLLRRRV